MLSKLSDYLGKSKNGSISTPKGVGSGAVKTANNTHNDSVFANFSVNLNNSQMVQKNQSQDESLRPIPYEVWSRVDFKDIFQDYLDKNPTHARFEIPSYNPRDLEINKYFYEYLEQFPTTETINKATEDMMFRFEQIKKINQDEQKGIIEPEHLKNELTIEIRDLLTLLTIQQIIQRNKDLFDIQDQTSPEIIATNIFNLVSSNTMCAKVFIDSVVRSSNYIFLIAMTSFELPK